KEAGGRADVRTAHATTGCPNVMHFGLVVLQQRKLKGCARTVMRYGPEPPAVILHNGATDREPHPHAMHLGGVERSEDLVEMLPLDPHTGVLDSNEHLVRFILTRTDEQLARSIGYCCQSFDTVHHQIEKDLL